MQKTSVYPPPSTPPKGRKTDHHNTRARRGSIADQQLSSNKKISYTLFIRDYRATHSDSLLPGWILIGDENIDWSDCLLGVD
jgi:hypothetical protein